MVRQPEDWDVSRISWSQPLQYENAQLIAAKRNCRRYKSFGPSTMDRHMLWILTYQSYESAHELRFLHFLYDTHKRK